MLIYDSLVIYDENYEAVPNLATEWSQSDDNLTWTFKLQEGVKWHDGEPFTSADVKFTYDLMMDTGLGYMYSSYLTGITEVQTPDDLTVVIVNEATHVILEQQGAQMREYAEGTVQLVRGYRSGDTGQAGVRR